LGELGNQTNFYFFQTPATQRLRQNVTLPHLTLPPQRRRSTRRARTSHAKPDSLRTLFLNKARPRCLAFLHPFFSKDFWLRWWLWWFVFGWD